MLFNLLAQRSVASLAVFLVALVFPGVATFLIRHQPLNPIGWLFCFFGLGVSFSIFSNDYGARSLPALTVWFYWLDRWLWALAFLPLITILPLLFPAGQPPTPRWRWVLWLALAGILLIALSSMTMPWPPAETNLINPTGLPGLVTFLDILFNLGLLLVVIGAAGGVLAVVWRYRRAAGYERLQLKWFVAGAGATILGATALFFLSVLGRTELGLLVNAVGALFLPLTVGVAILRYRLYDIDVIVRRTLVYALLTAILAVIYFGSVIALQAFLRTLTGQESQLAIVGSTLAIAALFTPLRQRIQNVIDRRFYRRKYDAAKMLATFSAVVRDEVDLDHLAGALLTVVEETMQPLHLSLWLKPAVGGRRPRLKKEAQD
jgi:hypothetical protein